MTDQSALAKTNQNRQLAPMQRIENYILSPEVKAKMSDMMGANAIYYLNQVIILVAGSDALQKCTPQSILISAMRAASLRLSVDPAKGQAWIIPYSGTATFQIGYKGVYELAMRTNQYRYINVIPVFEGELVIEERMTGMHSIEGKRAGDKVIARMLYFELFNGYKKTFCMSVEQIEAHARQYSKAYQYDLSSGKKGSKWSDPVERPKMEDKTVLINGLRKWGRFNEADDEMLQEIESETSEVRFHTIPAENEVTVPDGLAAPTGPTISPAKANELIDELGFETEASKTAAVTSKDLDWARAMKAPSGKLFGEMTSDQLTLIMEHKAATAEQKKAASMLIEFKITGNPF